MKTEVFVKILSDTRSTSEMNGDLEAALAVFRDFETRFSRFREESELSRFNALSEARVSQELFLLLKRSKRWFRETGGVFDVTILRALENEGYAGSFQTAEFGIPKPLLGDVPKYTSENLSIDENGVIRKPDGLKVDLGGIGKGYAIDRVSELLAKKYRNFFVYAGGDIFASGRNVEEGYDFWAVDIEDPTRAEGSDTTLLLSDRAVATSGTGRRRWRIKGEERHHLIDPRTRKSADTDLCSVTVIADSVERAEVFSKTICILGSSSGMKLAQERSLPVIFIGKDGTMTVNEFAQEFLWKQ